MVTFFREVRYLAAIIKRGLIKVFIYRTCIRLNLLKQATFSNILESNFEGASNIDDLRRLFDLKDISYLEGEHAIYLPPQSGILDMLGDGFNKYPTDSGLKVLKTFGAPKDISYIYGKDLMTKKIMTGSLNDLKVSATRLHELGLGPKLYDLVEIHTSKCVLSAFIVDHVRGRDPTKNEYHDFMNKLQGFIATGNLAVVPLNGLKDDDFGPFNCNKNLVTRCSDNVPMYIDFQQIISL